MGIISKFAKLGVAKKLIDEARKPENQRRAKEAFAQLQSRRKQGRPRP